MIDGGSTDGTVDILRSYGDRLTWVSERDRGPATAVNKGWSTAAGEILHWLNSDDVLLPGAVSAAVTALERNPHAVAAYGPGQLIDAAGAHKAPFPVPHVDPDELTVVDDLLLQPAVFIRASALARSGPLDERLQWVFDWDLFIRLSRCGEMTRVGQPLAAWRHHEAIRTSTGGRARLFEICRMLRRHRVPVTAPAYRIHGGEALRDALHHVVARGPAFAKTPARRLVESVSWHVATLRSFLPIPEGHYEDGWAGPRVRWLPEAQGSRLRIAGSIDIEHFPALAGQVITVSVDGTVHERLPLTGGDFTLELAGPFTPRPVIEMRARKAFVPHHLGLNEDRRRLSYVLTTIEITE